MRAEGEVTVGLTDAPEPVAGLEPLPLSVHQAHERLRPFAMSHITDRIAMSHMKEHLKDRDVT